MLKNAKGSETNYMQKLFLKKVLLKISQNSHENTGARVSLLMNLQAGL